MTILIDGDILIYKASAAAEVETVWEGGLITLHSSTTAIGYILSESIDSIRTELGRKRKVIIALTHKENFRKMLYPDYKGHRTGRKPLGYQGAVEYIREHWDSVTLPALEADDVMGIMATSGRYKDPIIVTEDKDLKQIPVPVYNPRTKEMVHNSPEEGQLYHMVQSLAGDRADNYPGCPGYGEISATKLLSSLQPDQWWPAVVASYEKKGLSEDDAILQARLAYMLQVNNYDKGKIKLWEPPGYGIVSGADSKSKPRATPSKSSKSAKATASSKKRNATSTKARPKTGQQRARASTRRTTASGKSSPSTSS